MAAVNVQSLKKENYALNVQIEYLTASMLRMEENLNVCEATAGNSEKIEGETQKRL